MKVPALKQFRSKLAADKPVYGLWITLEAASITEMAVALGLDWVVIDAEHGHLDWHDILEHIRATVRSKTVALVRVADLNIGLIKRALDIGADGVVVPWVQTAAQLEQAVAFAHYPPQGLRGIGGERATAWGQCTQEHVAEADQNVLVVPIIESVETGRDIDAILDVSGVDVYYFGPADFSSTAGFPGQWEGPGVAQQILAIKDKIRRKGRHCGVIATNHDNIIQRHDQGFRMIGLGLDGALILRSLRDTLARLGRESKITLTFEPQENPNCPTSHQTPEPPPESFRPDRPELVTTIGAGSKTEIEPDVVAECLVGPHNQAKNLITGLVTFGPGARLSYHLHPFNESLTLISGEAYCEIEGRRYTLYPLDNVVIPRGRAHHTVNLSASRPAVFHIAMDTDRLSKTLVRQAFMTQNMPDLATGMSKAERVNRFKSATRYDQSPHVSVIDFYRHDLMPGIKMCGGYAEFRPGGRLPAHVHEFDESICIIEGSAMCVVEGRRYTMSDGATALQPRGRVHYFMNQTDQPMAMLWVYAGSLPQRLVVDERSATVEGDPWRCPIQKPQSL